MGRLSAERRQEIGLARTRAADKRAFELLPVIESIKAAGGPLSLREIASALVERRVPTPAGRRCWQATTVKRVLRQAYWHRNQLEWLEFLAARQSRPPANLG
jgi:hypothetical protein